MTSRATIPSACAALVLCWPALGCPATDESQAQRLHQARAALRTATRFMQQRKHVEALEHYREADQLVPGQPVIRYDIACALARIERTDEALDALEQAVKLGFNNNAKDLPVYAVQGTKDEIVPLRAAEQSLETMKNTARLRRCCRTRAATRPRQTSRRPCWTPFRGLASTNRLRREPRARA